MNQETKPTNKKSKNSAGPYILVAVILLLLAGGIWYFAPDKKQPVSEPEDFTSEQDRSFPASGPEKPKEVMDYSRMKDDRDYQEMMSERKEKYGLDESVDMIVESDESIKIGETTMEMSEILEKIRISEGEVVERDLAGSPDKPDVINEKALKEELERKKNRYYQLNRELAKETPEEPTSAEPEIIREHSRLSKLASEYMKYTDTVKEIDQYTKLLKDDREKAKKKLQDEKDALKDEKGQLERHLSRMLLSDENAPFDEEKIAQKIEEYETRLDKILEKLKNPETEKSKQETEKLKKEYLKLSRSVNDYELYKQLIQKTENLSTLLEDDQILKKELRNRIEFLKTKKQRMEIELARRVIPDEKVEVYGIHVVRPGDNIWNIHFNFLQEYFSHRGVRVSPTSDEPVKGRSTGVGKILKFSENMVYIYNLKDQKLDVNLDLIHPMSKIVIFNMGRAFSLLNKIDYDNINEIRFDGETLWLPSET